MKRITRAQLRGRKLDELCRKAHTAPSGGGPENYCKERIGDSAIFKKHGKVFTRAFLIFETQHKFAPTGFLTTDLTTNP